MKLSVLFVANNRRVKWIIAYVVLLSVVGKAWFFTYNPYFELVQLPLPYYGWIFFGLNLVAALFSFSADWLSRRLSTGLSLVLMLILTLTGLPILLMSVIVAAPMAMLVLVQSMVRGYLKPFTEHFLNEQLDSTNRATIVSVKAAVDGLAQFVFLGAFAFIMQAWPLTYGMFILGLVALAVDSFLLTRYKQMFKPEAG